MSTAQVAGRVSWRMQLARRVSDPMMRSAYSLMLNVALTSVLGFGFWIAAARLLPSGEVGRDSALISAMITISVICQLNLGPGILRFLPITKLPAARAVLAAYAASSLFSAVGGTAFVLLAPRLSAGYGFLADDPGLSVLYVAAVTLWGVFALQDAVLTALRRAPWVPVENGAFGVLKIAALPLLLLAGSSHSVFVGWIIPMVMLVIPVNWFIFGSAIPHWPGRASGRSPVERFGWGGLRRFLAQDYLAAVCTQAASTLLPVLTVALIGSSQSAYFYMPFTIVSAFDLLFVNIASSLTVEGAMAGARYPVLVRRVVRRFRYVLIAGVALLIVGANLIVLPFGAGYAHFGPPVLRLLACASAFRAVVSLYCGICRVEGRASRILAVQGSILAMVMVLTVVLGKADGINGVALAWLIANAVAGCAAAPSVVRVLRRGNAMAETGGHVAGG